MMMDIQQVNYLLKKNTNRLRYLEEHKLHEKFKILNTLFRINQLLQVKSELIIKAHHLSQNKYIEDQTNDLGRKISLF